MHRGSTTCSRLRFKKGYRKNDDPELELDRVDVSHVLITSDPLSKLPKQTNEDQGAHYGHQERELVAVIVRKQALPGKPSSTAIEPTIRIKARDRLDVC